MISVPFSGAIAAQRKIHYLHRIDVAENAGTPGLAKVLVRDTDQNGTILVPISIAASDSKHLAFNPPIQFPNGVYVQVSLGTVRGSITGE